MKFSRTRVSLTVATTMMLSLGGLLSAPPAIAGPCASSTSRPLVMAVIPAAGGTYKVFMLYPQVADSNSCIPVESPSTPDGYCLSWVDGPTDFLSLPGVGDVTVVSAVPSQDLAPCMVNPL